MKCQVLKLRVEWPPQVTLPTRQCPVCYLGTATLKWDVVRVSTTPNSLAGRRHFLRRRCLIEARPQVILSAQLRHQDGLRNIVQVVCQVILRKVLLQAVQFERLSLQLALVRVNDLLPRLPLVWGQVVVPLRPLTTEVEGSLHLVNGIFVIANTIGGKDGVIGVRSGEQPQNRESGDQQDSTHTVTPRRQEL